MSSTDPKLNSLVKYGPKVLVSTSGKKLQKENMKEKKEEIEQNLAIVNTEDILNSILPPREFLVDNKQLYTQSVLATPATRMDVIQLQNDLDERLQQRQARETGICPIREELYAQCFDELIRQITINCSERGLLLVRVRDEMRMTIQAYQTLYESAIAFGMRKVLQSEQKKAEMQNKIKELEQDCGKLQKEVEELEQKIDETVVSDKKAQEVEEKSHKDMVDNLKKVNQKIKDELEKILLGPQAQAQPKK